MSFTDGFGGIIDGSLALITTQTRSIGFIVPDCTITEKYSDRLTITQHPVELGAAITDHSYRNPSNVLMEIGFSNSTAGTYGWDQVAYQELLGLQQSRQPFTVSTGKRLYQNMLMGEIMVTCDQTSEYALMATVELQEVIIVGTSGIDTSSSSSPEQTSSPDASGYQQAGTANGVPSFAQVSAVQSGATTGGDFSSISGGQGFTFNTTGGF